MDTKPAFINVQPAFTDVQPAFTDVQPAFTDVQPAFTDVQPAFTDVQPAFTDVKSTFIEYDNHKQFEESELAATFLVAHRDEDPKCETVSWKLLVTEQEIRVINCYLGKILSKKFRGQKIVIAVILKGAAYFAVDLTRQMTIP
jgi:hypothetical protein